ncbi:hypothetical protein COU54_05800 [Candidatus Pacearchaeota archaeon CG10_big_fil_rev_8_21_14_0_10_31_24]|nr:MAG: hypothetical protein COU54_05800 [Candidatus Pacearchaeota archaeon CG10_big_fil_rev_8_21_14_0_10_31_24]
MKRVIVIGGGFAGSYVARSLEDKFNVILIDSKEYFEFTPSILRTLVEPEHLSKIQICHRKYLKRARLIIEDVKEITSSEIILGKLRLKFDYLVICSGSGYSSPIKDRDVVIATRGKNLLDKHRQLCEAKRVLIVGGGLVGVELAGEILDYYRDKEITLVHLNKKLIQRNSLKSIQYSEKFLKSRGVNLILEEKLIGKKSKNTYITDKGTLIKSDIIFLCTGISPQFGFMKKNLRDSLTDKNHIRVNDFLQVYDFRNIFSAGDITSIVEEKTAQNAEEQAKIVVANIINLEEGRKLKRYESSKRAMVISLGKHDGIFEKGNFVLRGKIPSILKDLIEWKEMRKFRT